MPTTCILRPACVLLLLVTAASLYAEKFSLDLYASKFDSIPIAVLKFKTADGPELTKNEPWKVIADDLEFTGRFTVVRATKIDSSLLIDKNVGIYIDGEYRQEGAGLAVDCFLRDATTSELLAGRSYQCEPRLLRTIAHRYANDIVQTVLGEPGIFLSRILFMRDERSVKNLGIMDYDGANVTAVTSNSSFNLFPTFGDSTLVYWTSYLRGKPDVYRMRLPGGKPEIFAYSRYVTSSPAVSPIDGAVAYASSREGNMEIYTCDADKTNAKRVTFSGGIDTSPAWSPNGYQIAFCSDRAGNPQIYVMDRDGANVKRLTFQGSWQDSPAWSPKGDRIAYASMQNGKFDIWTIAADGTDARQATSSAGHNEYPAWSPDGSHIAFGSTRGASSDIWAVRPDGTGLRQLSHSGNAKMPDWSK